MIAENVVDHLFFRDVIGARNYKVFNVVAAQQFSGGTVGDAAQHLAHLRQRYHVGIIPIYPLKGFPRYRVFHIVYLLSFFSLTADIKYGMIFVNDDACFWRSNGPVTSD